MNILFIALTAYLLGSIPFSVIISKLRGVNLGASGTGNLGGTNVAITSGFKWGILAMILDITKGFAAVIFARFLAGTDTAVIIAGLGAILGHDFSVFLGFKGGKGLATSCGAYLAVDPLVSLLGLLSYGIIIPLTRKLILTTLIVMTVMPLYFWLMGLSGIYIFFSVLVALLIYFTHRENIVELINSRFAREVTFAEGEERKSQGRFFKE